MRTWWKLLDADISINGKLSTAFQLYVDEKITLYDLLLHVSRIILSLSNIEFTIEIAIIEIQWMIYIAAYKLFKLF